MASINLALNRPATASSSVSPYTPDRAVNGTLTQFSRWLCNTVPAWMSVDLGAPYWISRWVVRGMTAATPAPWRTPDYNMSDFKLQVSNDNKTWADIDAVVNNTLNVYDKTFTAVCCRYVRLYVSKGLRTNTQYASLMEFEVYSAPSAYLTNLTASNGALTPAFNRYAFAYTAPDVNYETSSIAVIPTLEDPQATVKINGNTATNGQPSNVNLNVGSNAISVTVTAAGGSPVNTYTITVVRKGSPYLTALSLSDVPFTFTKNTYTYNASTAYSVSSTNISFTKEDSTAVAVITVNGTELPAGQTTASLNVGSNTILVTVTAFGGVTQTYTVTVVRENDVRLSGLNLKSGKSTITYTPDFNSNITQYETQAMGGRTTITITATTADSAASININGTVVSSSQPVTINNLPAGRSLIKIIVTLGSSTKEYSVAVNN